MSWISDVRYELHQLDVSKKSLRKFGFTIGAIFVLLGLLFQYFNVYAIIKFVFFIFGVILVIFASIAPSKLLKTYKIWMGTAFVIGWFVSRILLSILFIFLITPIGIIAKLVNKKFLDISFNESNSSYWLKTEKSRKTNYEKMY